MRQYIYVVPQGKLSLFEYRDETDYRFILLDYSNQYYSRNSESLVYGPDLKILPAHTWNFNGIFIDPYKALLLLGDTKKDTLQTFAFSEYLIERRAASIILEYLLPIKLSINQPPKKEDILWLQKQKQLSNTPNG